MKKADKIPRMTTGPIEDLGVVVNKLVKVGFAHIHGGGYTAHERPKFRLYISTLFGRETADIPYDVELFSFLSAVQGYLSEKKRYLSRVSFLSGKSEDSDEITGDLYQEN